MSFTNFLRKISTGYTEESNDKNLVGITSQLDQIKVKHNGESIVIKRDQNTNAEIQSLFAKTSRPCPPFCVQPMSIATGVETIGELEMLDYIQKAQADQSIMIIDSRLKNWVDKGTIPTAIHIPWTSLTSHDDTQISPFLLKKLGVETVSSSTGDQLDFTHAKTLVLFCNGTWCGQTSESIKGLLELSYPPEKLKYYRDGMQGWTSLGLTTVLPKQKSCEVKPSCEKPFRLV